MQIKKSSHLVTFAAFLLTATSAPGCGDKDASVDDSGRPALDADGDGVLASADCDDNDPNVKPGWPEVCDSKDNNCDGVVDEGVDLALYSDGDGDGFGAAGVAARGCEPLAGLVEQPGDCDDGDASVNPGVSDGCDGRDNNCDGVVDEDGTFVWYLDADGDGYGGEALIESCELPSGYVATSDDCDDSSSKVNPGAREVCDDQIDNDCDGGATECRYAGYSSDAPVHLYSGASTSSTSSSVGFGASLVRLEREGRGDLLIISAPYFSDSAKNGGAAFALEGALYDGQKATSASTFSVRSYDEDAYLGERMGRVDDIDGDGAQELLSSLVWDIDGVSSLVVALTSGAGTGQISVALSPLVLYSSGDPTGYSYGLGAAMDGVGDHDADGVADLVLADPSFYGSDGLSYGKLWVLPANHTGTLNVHEVAVGTIAAGSSQGFASDVVWAGDTNGDGFDDLLVGSYQFSGGAKSSRGAVLLFEGPISGERSPEEADQVIYGDEAEEYLGYRVERVGDYNGDGYADLMATAPGDSTGASQGGAVGLWLSPITGKTLSSAEVQIFGKEKGSYAFQNSFESGDSDGDGYRDIIVSDPNLSGAGLSYNGAVGMLYGPETGTYGIVDLPARFIGNTSYEYLGNYATFVDLDGDGSEEIALTDPDAGFESVGVFPGLGL